MFLHFVWEKPFYCISTFIIFCIGSIVRPTIREDPTHVSKKELLGCVVFIFPAFSHRFQIYKRSTRNCDVVSTMQLLYQKPCVSHKYVLDKSFWDCANKIRFAFSWLTHGIFDNFIIIRNISFVHWFQEGPSTSMVLKINN